ncbi:hypothetical protein J6590_016487 [Homalodisca vitripennis]|nr:hypothetical protein J6590_016487 [Homalodisca vitripennis]
MKEQIQSGELFCGNIRRFPRAFPSPILDDRFDIGNPGLGRGRLYPLTENQTVWPAESVLTDGRWAIAEVGRLCRPQVKGDSRQAADEARLTRDNRVISDSERIVCLCRLWPVWRQSVAGRQAALCLDCPEDLNNWGLIENSINLTIDFLTLLPEATHVPLGLGMQYCTVSLSWMLTMATGHEPFTTPSTASLLLLLIADTGSPLQPADSYASSVCRGNNRRKLSVPLILVHLYSLQTHMPPRYVDVTIAASALFLWYSLLTIRYYCDILLLLIADTGSPLQPADSYASSVCRRNNRRKLSVPVIFVTKAIS